MSELIETKVVHVSETCRFEIQHYVDETENLVIMYFENIPRVWFDKRSGDKLAREILFQPEP